MLTSITLKALKGNGKKQEIRDGAFGLILIVSPTGVKRFVVRLNFNKKLYSKSLGQYPDISLQEARAQAEAFCREVKGQENVMLSRKTFMQVYTEWTKEKKPTIKHWDKVELLFRHVMPTIGKIYIGEIDDATLKLALKDLEETDRIDTLHRVIFKVNEVMRFAYSQGYIDRVKTEYAITRFKKKAPCKHRANIDPDRICDVFKIAEEHNVSSYGMTYMLWSIYSMLRPKENSCLQWSYVDFENKILTIPADVMKMGNEHKVPLSNQMLELLYELRTMGLSDTWIFPSQKSTDKHINPCFLSNILKRIGLKDICSAHGFRATARTWLAREHVHQDTAEACLAHIKGTAVEQAYNHEDFFNERRKVMALWCNFVDMQRL